MKNFAVVGMGSIAKRHVANLKQLYPRAKIFSVSASGKNRQKLNGVESTVSIDDLISLQPEFTIVASPAPFHIDTAKQLLENNIAVLIEKPLADTILSAREMAQFLQEKTYKPVAVGYCLRFLPSAQVVKKFIESGKLGKIYNVLSMVGQYLPSWRSDKDYKDSVSARKELGGGALLELSHELDYLMWIFGPLSLQYSHLKTTDELGINVEDVADLVLTANSNLHISVHLDFVQKSTLRKCEIIGEKGRIVWDIISNSVLFYDEQGEKKIYSDAEYNKNNMYLDMLNTFSLVEHQGMKQLASVQSSVKIIQLIDEAKQADNWRLKTLKTIAFIFARGGSKGLPGKNVKLLNGKPLLQYSIEIAKNTNQIDNIFVSTDCDEIAGVARKNGVQVIKRPDELATDTSPEWLSWQHAIDYVTDHFGQFEYFISLPATSPLRSELDVVSALKRLTSTEADICVSVTPANRSPYFNMVRMLKDNSVEIVNQPEGDVWRRQDAPEVYDITTVVYAATVRYIKEEASIFSGKVVATVVPKNRAVDIDDIYDFMLAELILRRGINDT